MKLFQRLLVAPAALGLLSPLAANASEVNLSEIASYSDVDAIDFANSFNKQTKTKAAPLIAGGEGLHRHSGGNSFSSTTSATFSADMATGYVDGLSGNEALTAGYSFQIDLNTTFNGEDSLDISIDAGNSDAGNLDELDLNDGGDGLTVDGISYTFPVGDKVTFFVGDNVDGSSLYNTACVYGGVTDVLDDCGNASSAMDEGAGTAFGASYDFGNGFTGAIGYTGAGSSTDGLMTKLSSDTFGGQVTYTDDSFGASVTYAVANTSGTDTTYWGFNGYWTPSEAGSAPSISVGYEVGDLDKADSTNNGKDTKQWFVGLQWDEVGSGTLGAAYGTAGAIDEGETDYFQYEAFYSYPLNDAVTVTPVLYVKETSGDDQTGVMVKTSFSF